MESLPSFLFPLVGYLSGSLPFSVWVTRFARGVDVRNAGSGHATTTNTIRQAGGARILERASSGVASFRPEISQVRDKIDPAGSVLDNASPTPRTPGRLASRCSMSR